MNRFLTTAFVGLAVYGMAANLAFAGGLLHGHCCQKCTIQISCKQYNAFSPFCCDPGSAQSKCHFGHGCKSTHCAPGCDTCQGELPGAEMAGTPAEHSHAIQQAPSRLPSMIPGTQTWSAWGPGMINPDNGYTGYPSTGRSFSGFAGH